MVADFPPLENLVPAEMGLSSRKKSNDPIEG